MARIRVKTRVEHLADSLVELNKANKSLHEIDLRTTPRDQREKVKAAREFVSEALALTGSALRSDNPTRSTGKIAV